MSIFLLCGPESPGAYADLYWSKHCKSPVYLREIAAGKVVSSREMNGYDDSDFYASYLDDDGEFKEVMYASTRGWSYPANAVIDAPAELIAKYKVWKSARDSAFYAALDAIKEARSPKGLAKAKGLDIGASAKVVKGRKVSVGSVGFIAAIEPNHYDDFNPRVGLQVNGSMKWSYLNNLEAA